MIQISKLLLDLDPYTILVSAVQAMPVAPSYRLALAVICLALVAPFGVIQIL
jgi:hypothetical protein